MANLGNRISNAINNTFGAAQQMNENPTLKDNLMHFKKDKVYVSLVIKQYYDKKKGAYNEPVARLTCSADGVFFNLPLDTEFLRAYGEFMLDLAKALDGFKIDNTDISKDVRAARKSLEKLTRTSRDGRRTSATPPRTLPTPPGSEEQPPDPSSSGTQTSRPTSTTS
jgi:hypothetical protein